GLLLTLDDQRFVGEFDLDILLVKTWYLGGGFDFFVVLAALDIRPADRTIKEAIRAERYQVEAAKNVVEQPIHFAVQSNEGVGFFAPSNSHIAPAAQWDQISHRHSRVSFFLSGPQRKDLKRALRPPACARSASCRCQR